MYNECCLYIIKTLNTQTTYCRSNDDINFPLLLIKMIYY